MGLRLEDKQAMVTEVQAVAQTAHSVVAAEYRGLTVTQLTGLRAKARASGVYMRAEPKDMSILDGRDDQKRMELIAERLKSWKSIKST